MRLARNSTYLFGARVVNSLAIWIFILTVSRWFGPEVFGQFSFLNTIVLTGIVAANFGLDAMMVREVSRDQNRGGEWLVEVLSFKVGSSVVVAISACAVFYFLLDDRAIFRLLAVYSLTIVMNSLAQSFWYYGDAFQKFQYHSFFWAFSNVIKIPALCIAVFFRKDLASVIEGLVVAELISLLVASLWVRHAFSLRLVGFSYRYVLSLFEKGWLLAVVFILSAVYSRFDVIMLNFMQGKNAVGLYSAAYKFIEFVSIIPGTICVAALPGLAVDYVDDYKGFRVSCRRTLRMLMVGGLLIGGGIFLMADVIIPLFYGQEFLNSIECLKILGIVVFFLFVNGFCTCLLIATNNERCVVSAILLATIVNIGLNYLLIPPYSYLGAAFATVISELFLLLNYFFILLRKKEFKSILW